VSEFEESLSIQLKNVFNNKNFI